MNYILVFAIGFTAAMSHSHVHSVRFIARCSLLSIVLWALLFWGQW